jgi:acetyltransferase-like isoleucine patch superfamily enzyme
MLTLPNLILIGAGGHARSCIDVIEQESKFRIAGLVGLKQDIGAKYFGYEVIGTDEMLRSLSKEYQYALIALGQIITPEIRSRLFLQALSVGFEFPTFISPQAYVSSNSKIGSGTIVMHGSIINAGVTIGENCIINSNSLIEHDSKVGDHCHISTGAIINGDTTIESGSFIGSGAIIKEGIFIGGRSIVGMGLTVRGNLNSNSKFLGEV